MFNAYKSNSTVKTMRPLNPPVHVIKQSVSEDAKPVEELETSATMAMFGRVNILESIANYVCKSMFNEDDELVAFIVLRECPNIHCLTNCSWENWAKSYYSLDSVSSWNTTFINYIVWDQRYPNFIKHFLQTFYKNNFHLENIVLVVPPGVGIFKELTPYFSQISPKNVQMLDSTVPADSVAQTLLLNSRLNTLKKLVIRKAQDEDNIDLQPILHCQYDILKQVYGDFKLNKVIDDPTKSVLVAEKDDHVVVGMMSLTSAVNYQHVNTFFHIPLSDYMGQVDLQGETNVTISQVEWQTTEDITSFQTNNFKEESSDVESIESTFSASTYLYLKDSESEFRIVDPAMAYLLNKHPNKEEATKIQAKDSVECKVYFEQSSKSDLMSSESSQTRIILGKQITPDDLPVFIVPDNGFQVSLFALHPDLDTRYAFDLLEASFACFPDKYYCLLSLPTTYQGSPLVQHFVRLSPRLSQDFPHELYMVHRNSIFSEFTVREMSSSDFDSVADLLCCANTDQKIIKDIGNLLFEDDIGSQCFVLICEYTIIGFALVTGGFRLVHVEPDYCLEEVLEGDYTGTLASHGVLRHAIVDPVFLRAAPFFLRQVLRLAGLDSLSYCLTPTDTVTKRDIAMPTVLGDLRPVRPRRRVQYDLSALEEYLVNPDTDYALFIATEKTLSVPKLELNYRVVVVGASDVALSFLEHLIFGAAKRSILYNNLTLISLHGLPLEHRPHVAAGKMNPHNGHYDRDYLARLSLKTHVNVFYGIVTDINRDEKMVCVNREYWMRYDYLFLFSGAQFCRPIPASLEETDTKSCQKYNDACELYAKLADVCGDNLFAVNSTADASIVLGRLKKIVATKKPTGKILVYGNCINIYCCVEALLTFKVPGDKIVVIQSPDICSINGLGNNETVEKAVLHSLQQIGVTVHLGYTLRDWVNAVDKTITKVMFRSENKGSISVECLAFFCYAPKVTSAKTYMAISNAGIVYNSGIVINNEFRTNDEYIFAAGPGTKYSSCYTAGQTHHRLYSSLEVGYQASQIFRAVVEPADPKYPLNLPQPGALPSLTWPITLVAKLPGGWNYFRVSAPGPPLPLECQRQSQGDSGRVLITGNPFEDVGPGYFQLSLSVFNTVVEVACLSKREIPHRNLQCLYGKHEKLLNNLVERYDLGLVPDLYAFFSQPWAYALYTSGFDDLVRQGADMFIRDAKTGQEILKLLKSNHSILEFKEALNSVVNKYEQSLLPLDVQQLTMRYVMQRSLQLPMYLDDAQVEVIRRAYSTSPLYRPKRRSPSPLRVLVSASNPWRSS